MKGRLLGGVVGFNTHRLGILCLVSLLVATLFFSGCAARYYVKSYPDGATVYAKDVVTGETKKLGVTPLNVKKSNDIGEVFFLSLEKENYFPKQVLLTPKDGENLTLNITLEPMDDKSKALAKEGDKDQGKPDDKDKDKEMKDLALRVALLENTLQLYKDALFSGRYGGTGGYAKFDRDHTDEIVDHLFRAQQHTMLKRYNEALTELDKALLLDEYLPQAYLIKGSIYYLTKRLPEAKLAWERCLKIDPYNAQAYEYLRLVSNKMGVSAPPDRPSMLRAPASDPFSKSLR